MSPDSRHDRTTREEFTRQGEAMLRSRTFRDPDLLDRIAAALGSGSRARVLDVACGAGIVAQRLCAPDRAVIGIDFTPAMLTRARELCQSAPQPQRAHFLVGRAERTPFADATFDAVVTRLSLHHVQDPAALVAEIARVLRPGGRAVFADITASADPDAARLHDALERLRDPSHVRLLPRAELRRTVSEAGLQIGDTRTWSLRRPVAEWLAITTAGPRADDLLRVMAALAEAGVDTGLELATSDGELHMTHHFSLIAADR